MLKIAVLTIILTSCLLSCNLSSKLFFENSPTCSNFLEVEKKAEVHFIKNKEFKKVSNLLKKDHGATTIRLVIFFKPKKKFYCEFNKESNIIHCLLLDESMKVISKEKVEFDY
jgi:hypothetical protein